MDVRLAWLNAIAAEEKFAIAEKHSSLFLAPQTSKENETNRQHDHDR